MYFELFITAALLCLGEIVVALGLTVHGWWTRRNGIRFFSPEPWDRYRALRGWS